ncbi:MAG: hypothetical protein U0103_00230 [Candidatus Obscuribacterales bacterium]
MTSARKRAFNNPMTWLLLVQMVVTSTTLVALRADAQSISQASPAPVQANSGDFKPSTEAQKLLVSVADLVKEFFPKAKIVTAGNSLHFEYKVHERMHPYNRRTVPSPDLDGILGDIEVKPGGQSDRIAGVIERPEAIHSVLLMAPYSASDKSLVSVRLVFQPITPLEFMESFKRLISTYDHPDGNLQANAGPVSPNNIESLETTQTAQSLNSGVANTSQTTRLENATASNSSERIKVDNAQKGSPSSSESSKRNGQDSSPEHKSPSLSADSETGANSTAVPPMDKYSYPEGRFKVMLPGSPQVKYSNQAGMRMVDYVYTVPDGTFNISYVILPSAPPNLKTSQLLDNMSQSVVNSLKGLQTRQYESTLQGFQGCQLEVPQLANKPGQSARFRIYLVQNYIYIIGVNGKKDWMNSLKAREFLDSFQVDFKTPQQVTMTAPKSKLKSASQVEMEQARLEHRNQTMQQQAIRRMKVQKNFEQSRADREFNRVRP